MISLSSSPVRLVRACKQCGAELSADAHHLRQMCEPCSVQKRIRATERWMKSNPTKRLYYNAKQRALKLDLPFTITEADIFIPEFCPVLGIRIEPQRGGTRGFQDASPSLDRMIPALGYVPGNVAVISGRANLLKRDGSLGELERLVAWMRAMGCK